MSNKISATDSVCQRLADDIYALHFQPGARLTETELSARYGVSRNTLREAIAYLISNGLLEKKANAGISVRALGESDVREIFHLRLLLELEAVRALLEQDSVPPTLSAFAAKGARLEPGANWREGLEADVAFHTTLVQSAGSTRLTRLYDGLVPEIKLCIYHSQNYVTPQKERLPHHLHILEAIREKNGDRAAALLTDHISSAVTSYAEGIRMLTQETEY